jgi:hypothetical protein
MARRLTTYLEKSRDVWRQALTGVTHAIRTVMLVMEVAVRDCKNHAILLDDWRVDDLPRKVYETCGRHCKAGTAGQALRMRFGSYQDAKTPLWRVMKAVITVFPS